MATASWSASPACIAAGLRRSDQVFRIGGDEFAVLMPGVDADGAYLAMRRVLATVLERGVDDRRPERTGRPAVVVHGRHLGGPGDGDRSRDAVPRGRCRAGVRQEARPDMRVGVRPRAARLAGHRAIGCRDARRLVARVAASGALESRSSSRSSTCAAGRPRGYEALSRPMPGSGFTDATDLFTAAEAFGRTVELDLASLTTSIAAFARLALPGSLTLNISPRSLESDQFSVHGLVQLLHRHGVDPARVVLELTEREAVEDMDRLIRAVEACRAAGMRVAADDVGAGNAGLRLLSQLRFDIVKIDLSLVQGGAVRATSHEVVRTLKDLADRWGALVIAEGVETVEQLEFVRSLGIRAGQGYLLGVPVGAPVDRDGRSRRARPLPDPRAAADCAPHRSGMPRRLRVGDRSPRPEHGPRESGTPRTIGGTLTGRPIPARLSANRTVPTARTQRLEASLGRFDRQDRRDRRRRRDGGWSPRPHAHRAEPARRRIAPRASSLASGA